MFNVAMVGWGMSARTFHLPLLEANRALTLKAIVTSKTQQCAEQWPNVFCAVSIEQLIANCQIDLAIVATPNHLHFEHVEVLLKAGIHVVVDKPATTNVSELEALFHLAHERERILAVFHNRRWDGDFIGLQAVIDEGLVGRPKVLLSHFDRFRPLPRDRWREHAIKGAGIWFDLGPHLVDQALCLFGRPQAITAQLRALREGALTTDYAHVSLHYPELEVLLRSSPYCSGQNLRFQLEGDAGTWRKYDLDPQEACLAAGHIPDTEIWKKELPAECAFLSSEKGELELPLPKGDYGQFYRSVVSVLAGDAGAKLPVGPQQAIDVATVIDAAVLSSSQGGRYELQWQNWSEYD